MFRQTLANLFNFFTTFLFQATLAYRFGAEKDLSILLILIGISTSVISIFANTAQVGLLPSIASGGISKRIALKRMRIINYSGNLINVIVTFSLAQSHILNFQLDKPKIYFCLLFGALQLLALNLTTLLLSKEKVSLALFSPSIPSLIGIIYTALTNSIYLIMSGLVFGTFFQIIFLILSLKNSKFTVEENSVEVPKYSALFLNLFQYFSLSMVSIIQKMGLQNHSFESLSIFNYADRIASNAQGVAINGISIGLFSEWSKRKKILEAILKIKHQIIQVYEVLFLVAIILSSFSGEIVTILFQRGEFDRNISLQVSQVLLQMQILIVLQTIGLLWANIMYSLSRINAPSFFGIFQSTVTIVICILNWDRLSAIYLVEKLIAINSLVIMCKLSFISLFFRHRIESVLLRWFTKISVLYFLIFILSVSILLNINYQMRIVLVLIMSIFGIYRVIFTMKRLK